MVGEYKKFKTESGGENTDVSPAPVPKPVAPQPASQPPMEEFRDEITAIMQELLLKVHEASFEYSTMDCKDLPNCPLAKACKEIFKTVKKLNEMVKQMTVPPSSPPSYTG